jgi:hypothetical protein
VLTNQMGEGGSVVKMLVERAKLSIYVDGMGPICKKAGWGRWGTGWQNS